MQKNNFNITEESVPEDEEEEDFDDAGRRVDENEDSDQFNIKIDSSSTFNRH
jgi:hypothetical protein